MSKVTNVFLLAENRPLREALIRLLSRKNDTRIVGASAYSPAIDREITAAQPHIVLLDSNGFSLSRATVISALRAANENLQVVLVKMDPDETTFVGYVLKDASALEVLSAIRAVLAGRRRMHAVSLSSAVRIRLGNLWRRWPITMVTTALAIAIASWAYIHLSASPGPTLRFHKAEQTMPTRSSYALPGTRRSHTRAEGKTQRVLPGFQRLQVGPNETDYIAEDVTMRVFTPPPKPRPAERWNNQVDIGDDATVRTARVLVDPAPSPPRTESLRDHPLAPTQTAVVLKKPPAKDQ